MPKYYEVTEFINPCDKCKGKKFVVSDDSHWQAFQKEFAKVFESSPKPLSVEALEQIKAKMPKFPALETCGKCNGEGRYRKKVNLREAMIELMSDKEFDRIVQSNREFAEGNY